MVEQKDMIVFSVLGILGAVLNSLMYYQGFIIWIFTNSYFAYFNFRNGDYWVCLMFLVYLCTSFYGLYRWLAQKIVGI